MRRVTGTMGLVMMLALAACGGLTPQGDGFDADALLAENGGFEMTDEAPQFGLPELWYNEDLPLDAEPSQPSNATARSYRVLVVRGSDGADASAAGEWNGRALQSGVSVRVLRKLRFEDVDVLVRNGADGQSFSSTQPHHDGMLLEVSVPEGAEGPVLAIEGAIDANLTVEQLSTLQELTERRSGDNWALFYAMPQRPCPSGYLAGRWKRVDDRGGVFMGRWARDDGAVTGHIRGIWGRRPDDGRKVFFGKVIGQDGRFKGIVRGQYDDHMFRGVYVNREGVAGALRGHVRGAERGFFHGRWERTCSAAAPADASGGASTDASGG